MQKIKSFLRLIERTRYGQLKIRLRANKAKVVHKPATEGTANKSNSWFLAETVTNLLQGLRWVRCFERLSWKHPPLLVAKIREFRIFAGLGGTQWSIQALHFLYCYVRLHPTERVRVKWARGEGWWVIEFGQFFPIFFQKPEISDLVCAWHTAWPTHAYPILFGGSFESSPLSSYLYIYRGKYKYKYKYKYIYIHIWTCPKCEGI